MLFADDDPLSSRATFAAFASLASISPSLFLGLAYPTYQATARRNGVFNSPAAGVIDMNQELLDPMERAFSTDWEQVVVSRVKAKLDSCEAEMKQLLTTLVASIHSQMASTGLEHARLAPMITTASRGCSITVRRSFQVMLDTANKAQQEFSRDLLPQIQAQMHTSYASTMSVRGGSGTFNRMKTAMSVTTQGRTNS